MRKVNKPKSTTYTYIERNISKIGPKTYRIRVGSHSLYAPTRDSARVIKRNLLKAKA